MSEPVAFYRGDWKGDLVFRKNNTVDVRKNKSDFTKGLIKPLYADNPNQPQLTIPKSVADELDDIFNGFVKERHSCSIWNLLWRAEEIDDEIGMQLSELLPNENQINIGIAYLVGKALGVDLVKVVEG